MADIIFDCPHCQQSLEAPPEGAGLTIACPKCSKDVVIPDPAPKIKIPKFQLKKQCPKCNAYLPSNEATTCLKCGWKEGVPEMAAPPSPSPLSPPQIPPPKLPPVSLPPVKTAPLSTAPPPPAGTPGVPPLHLPPPL